MARLAPLPAAAPSSSAATAAAVASAAAAAASTLARVAPSPPLPSPRGSRALFWATLPALAALLGLLWLRRRRPRRNSTLQQPPPPSAVEEAVPSSSSVAAAQTAASSMGEPVVSEEVRVPTGNASDVSPRRSRRRRHRRCSGSVSPDLPASPPPLQASKTSDGLTALFAPLPDEAKFAAAVPLSAPREESERSCQPDQKPGDVEPPAEESAPARDLHLGAPTVTREKPIAAPLASADAKLAPPSEVFGGSLKVPLAQEASALTGDPCAVITEATAVTNRAPGVISEASALTSEASNLVKEVPVGNGPTPTILSKAPALINEANALIREAAAIQNAVPALTLDSSETSTFKGEASEIIGKAPALITEASALLQEVRDLINQVPSQLLEGNPKVDVVKNGEVAPNYLEKLVAAVPKGHAEEFLVPQEEVLSTNSTLAGVEDFDTFELASEKDEGTRKSDLRANSGRDSEVISKSFEVCGEVVIPEKDFKQTGSEVVLKEESTNTELQGDCKPRVEFVNEVKSLSLSSEVYEDCRSRKENEAEELTGSIDSAHRRQKEETIELKSDNIVDTVERTSNLSKAKPSKQTSSPVLEEVATKAELVSHKSRQARTSEKREEKVCKGEIHSTREAPVKKEKLVANQASAKNKRRKKANAEAAVCSAKEGPVRREVTKSTCEQPPVEGKVCAKGDTEELVFATQATGCAESSPLVGAGEGASEQPVPEVTLSRHPRTDGEEQEGEKASSKQQQQQGEVPAHELARLLGQLRESGDETMMSTATTPSDAHASFATPRADEEPVRMRKDGAEGATGVEAAAARAAAAAGQRDSANHSPAEGMLASPRSHDVCSSGMSGDEEEGDSSDSGKGCSDAPTPPPSRTPASGSSVSGDALGAGGAVSPDAAAAGAHDDPATAAAAAAAAAAVIADARVYEFVLPQQLVGRLIGRHGCFVHQIKARTNASILIKRHPETARLKVCAVEGSPADVEGALEMIRQKFPQKLYPHVSLEQVCFVSPPLPVVPVLPDCLRLQLVEGISNDVILSSLVSPAHFFLQQPTHPTFPALARLCACMNATYGGEGETPAVPSVQAGIIVAAPVMGSWYRAEVVAAEPNSETCQVRYVDYGGYEVQQNSALRQIRSDFMTLPFQAAECYLANVICNSEEEGWSNEAFLAVDQLTAGQVLQAQVCGYCEDGLPAVSLYMVSGSQVISVSQELVARGLGQWWEPTDG